MQIYIGGWENTGTRVVVEILKLCGYSVTKINSSNDYLAQQFRDFFKSYLDGTQSIEWLYQNISNDMISDKMVFKHGHFSLLFDELKKFDPQSRFVLCIRNPLDSLIKHSQNYVDYIDSNSDKNPPIDIKFKYYKTWYPADVIARSDFICKLENLVNNPKEYIMEMLDSLSIEYTDDLIERCANMIITPSTIGAGVDKIRPTQEMLNFMEKFGY